MAAVMAAVMAVAMLGGSERERGCAIAIAIIGRRPPGFFWLFAIRELVSNKPCVILAASWWVSGEGGLIADGQCAMSNVETRRDEN